MVNYSAQVYNSTYKSLLDIRCVLSICMKLGSEILIVKLASSSIGERIFRDFRSEIYIASEEKTSADEKNGRLL